MLTQYLPLSLAYEIETLFHPVRVSSSRRFCAMNENGKSSAFIRAGPQYRVGYLIIIRALSASGPRAPKIIIISSDYARERVKQFSKYKRYSRVHVYRKSIIVHKIREYRATRCVSITVKVIEQRNVRREEMSGIVAISNRNVRIYLNFFFF